MNPKEIAEKEYQLQFWGFTSDFFFKDFSSFILLEMKEIFNLYTDVITEKEQKEQKTLMNPLSLTEIHFKWVEQFEHVMRTLEPQITQFFAIPKNVLLPSDYEFRESFSEQEIEKMDKEIHQLEKEYLKEKMFLRFCEDELEKINQLQSVHLKFAEAVKKADQLKQRFSRIQEIDHIAKTNEEYFRDTFSEELSDFEEEWLQPKFVGSNEKSLINN